MPSHAAEHDASQMPAAGPWQEGKPEEAGAYLIECRMPGSEHSCYDVASWKGESWHVWGAREWELTRYVEHYAEIQSDHA